MSGRILTMMIGGESALTKCDTLRNAQRRQAEYDRSATLLSYRTLKIPRR
jgi:hypothetical protein